MISRLRYTMREMWASLTRNLTLTVAAVITSTVSLFLFGMTLLIQQAFDNQRSNLTLQDYLMNSGFNRDKSVLDTILNLGYGGSNPAATLLAASSAQQPDSSGLSGLASLFAFRNALGQGQSTNTAPSPQAGVGGAFQPGGAFSLPLRF